MEVNYLRCSPNFYNHPRYDCVMANIDDEIVFAQLAHLFTIIIDGNLPLVIALVHRFEQQSPPVHIRKDRDLRFRLRWQDTGCFILVQLIIWGVPIFPAFDDERDSIVFDIVDTDMFLCISEILTH